MKADVQERIEAYLEGNLGMEETRAFEQELLDPEVATLFAEDLMLRELISTAPPDEPPQELVDSIIESLEIDREAGEKETRERGFPRMRLVLQGMGWSVASTRSGLSTMRYALGPLAISSRDEPAPAETKKKRSLWRRILWRRS